MSYRSIILAVILMIIVAGNSYNDASNFLPKVEAQGLQLRVSAAERPEFGNHFFGAQIVQVIISDPGATDPDESTVGLQVRGVSVPRVHLSDGLWYHFFAEEDAFAIFIDIVSDGAFNRSIAVQDATAVATPVTIGTVSYTVTTSADSFIRQITQVTGVTFIEVDQLDIFPTLPNPFFETAATINPDLGIPGNPAVGDSLCTFTGPAEFNLPDTDCDWPYIRLVNIEETDVISIRAGSASVDLIFDDFANGISTTVDRTAAYPVNSEIIVSLSDNMWNINPVEEDVLYFALNPNTGTPINVIYQPIRNFDPAGDGQNFPDLFPGMAGMDFDGRQVLEVDAPEGINALRFIHVLDVNTITASAPSGTVVQFATEPFIRTAIQARTLAQINAGTTTVNNSVAPAVTGTSNDAGTFDRPTILMIESDPNTSYFESINEQRGSRANLFAGANDRVASFDYFDIINTWFAGSFRSIYFTSRNIGNLFFGTCNLYLQ